MPHNERVMSYGLQGQGQLASNCLLIRPLLSVNHAAYLRVNLGEKADRISISEANSVRSDGG